MSIKRTTITAAFTGIFALTLMIGIGNAQQDTASNPVNTDPTETYRADYSDIGYLDIGFSSYVKGWVNGYLTPDDYPNGGAILPPPPQKGTPAYEADVAAFENLRALRDTDLGRAAVRDANLRFENIGKAYEQALGITISRKETPHLHLLLHRVLTDAAYASNSSKGLFKRIRPFIEMEVASCIPEQEAFLSRDGSYPSGHAVTGMMWGMTLTSIAPDRATELMQKARNFGHGRAICGVHWESDVEAGRMLAAGAFARIQASEEFQRQRAEAKTELDAIRSRTNKK